jgi:recombination protein RecA
MCRTSFRRHRCCSTTRLASNALGKSSAIAYPTIANVQAQGKLPALIAAEPAFDESWAAKLGVDTEMLLLQRPDSIEEAFDMLHDLVYGNLVDYIVFDSVGGMGTHSETEGRGKKAFGISGVVTSGLNAIMPRLWKNGQGLMLMNQQRQDTSVRVTGATLYESPGGEALKHHCVMRIQLKPGKERWTTKIDGEEVTLGRELVCQFKKNKLAMNSKAARFNFFYIPSEYGFGVDRTEDIIRTGKVTGVITGTNWLQHRSFPGGKLNGKTKVAEFLAEHPEAAEQIREDVLTKMHEEQIELKQKAGEIS